MAIFTQSIIDNNLLRKLTRKRHYQNYVLYWAEVTRLNLINEKTQLFITVSGSLEFLGQTLPPISVAKPNDYNDRARVIADKEKKLVMMKFNAFAWTY